MAPPPPRRSAAAEPRRPGRRTPREKPMSSAVAAAPAARTADDIHAPVRRDLARLRTGRALLAAAAATALAAGAAWYGYHWWTDARFIQTTDDAYVGGNVTPVAPHVSGFVAQVLVTDNQRVTAGQ